MSVPAELVAAPSPVLGRIRLSTGGVAVLVLLAHLAIGAYVLGWDFLSQMHSAVPGEPAGGGSQLMRPGDQFEQLYRYSLPRHNLEAGRMPFWSGYQYNLSSQSPPFYEGWVFFPFSFLHALLSLLTGDVLAYNLIALASFAFVGGAMYWLVFWLAQSHAAAAVSSLVLALLPHRTSFLLGEMAYGVDLMFAPLIVLFFEKFTAERRARDAALFAGALFLYSVSGFQGFFLFSLFSSPYFVVRTAQLLRSPDFPFARLGLLALAALPALGYMLYVRGLIGASGLSAGQAYEEARFYSPALANVFAVWSGNEKTVYLGFPLLGLLLAMIAFGLVRSVPRGPEARCTRSVFFLAFGCFVFSFLFCFGPNLDSGTGVPLYRLFFDYVPGGNATRTPGRLMGTAGFHFALALGLFAAFVMRETGARPAWRWGVAALASAVIVWDYDYVRPHMVLLERHNAAYERIRGAPGIVYAIPIQREAPHYYNATYLYYAQKYELRMFAGHSSIYPREWDEIAPRLLVVNAGRFGREEAEIFARRGIRHLVAHATAFEPNVSAFTVPRLRQSPYLRELASDNGIHVFEVVPDGSEGRTESASAASGVALKASDLRRFHFVEGWHAREAYPGQPAFRWMDGTRADGFVVLGEDAKERRLRFQYKCPLEDLRVTLAGAVNVAVRAGEGGWRAVEATVPAVPRAIHHLELATPSVYEVPTDKRKFGCMVGDLELVP